MFWGLHVKSSPKSSVPVEYEFFENVKLSQICLEPPMSNPVANKLSTPGGKNKKGAKNNQALVESPTASLTDSQKSSPVSLVVEYDKKQFILCTLDPTKNWQCPVDLVFQAGSTVKFSLRGNGTIHLTGYEIPDDDDDDHMMGFGDEEADEDDDDEEDDDEDDEEEDDEHVDVTNIKNDNKAKKPITNGVSKPSSAKKQRKSAPTTFPKGGDENDSDSSDDVDFEATVTSDDDEDSSMDDDENVDIDESDNE